LTGGSFGRASARRRVAATIEKERTVIRRKSKVFIAGLAAFLVGMPLAKETFAQGIGSLVGWAVDTSIWASDGGS
jgi:hypothetical protein